MFTGLVTATAVLASRTARGPGARLSFRATLGATAIAAGTPGRPESDPLGIGESVAVDGCCLSVADLVPDGFEVDASAETLARTTLGRLLLGRVV
ncbi:MAG: hypothetical protein M3O46_12650, partial [Myxococcota bacterium]|nr:hypothetical protein [Myxococcota bacterium]